MIPLYKPYMPVGIDLNDILYSGKLAYGDYVIRFEELLKSFFETEYLVVTNTFSNAINVALNVAGIKRDDEVILSPMGCLASSQPYLEYGLNVRWADVDSKRGVLSPDSVRKRITKKTKVIVNNHFCGYSGFIDEINEIGNDYGILVIDDGIECFGTEYKGRKIGCCGTDITVFSLGAVRIPNCIEGGIIIFKNREMYEKSLIIRDLAVDRAAFRYPNGEISRECDISEIGYSAMMSNINGYIGCKQMEVVDKIIAKNRDNAKKWDAYFSGNKNIDILENIDCKPNYWVYGMLADDKNKAMSIFREKGYYASGIHCNNSRYSVFGKCDTMLCGADEFENRFLALPCGWWIETIDMLD